MLTDIRFRVVKSCKHISIHGELNWRAGFAIIPLAMVSSYYHVCVR